MAVLWWGEWRFNPLTPGILTCDLSGLPPVFIGNGLFTFGRIPCCASDRKIQICVRGSGGVCVCVCVYVCVCVEQKERGGALLSLCSFGPEGRKPWK